MVFLGGGWEFREAEVLEVFVRADGFAPSVAQFAGKQQDDLSNGKARSRYSADRRFNCDLTFPKIWRGRQGTLPEAYFDDLQERMRIMRQPSNRQGGDVPDFNMLNLGEAGRIGSSFGWPKTRHGFTSPCTLPGSFNSSKPVPSPSPT